jgi:hypothetical protein
MSPMVRLMLESRTNVGSPPGRGDGQRSSCARASTEPGGVHADVSSSRRIEPGPLAPRSQAGASVGADRSQRESSSAGAGLGTWGLSRGPLSAETATLTGYQFRFALISFWP